MQITIAREIYKEGIGLHSGAPSFVRLIPADADTGISFRLGTDAGVTTIPATHDNLSGSSFRTSIGTGGTGIDTIEHIMAALYALGVDNAIIDIQGPEVPAVDGSSMPWCTMILDAGTVVLDSPRRRIRILKTVRVEDGKGAWCMIEPFDHFRMRYDLGYDHPSIGEQSLELSIDAPTFLSEIAAARTFGFIKDLDMLASMGLARGASLDNTLVFGEAEPLNQDGMRWSNEPVRHKMLDAIGDLSLIGFPLIGRFHGCRSGHHLNQQLLSAILGDATAWEMG